MSINLTIPRKTDLKPRITVFGIGGAGGNAVNNMIESGLEGVDFVVANTDAQALSLSSSQSRIQLGEDMTEGLGAGSRPEVGCAATEEALNEIRDALQGSHMAFITAGMGGGTGTGGAPVVARSAREAGILTVGVVTKPFQFEGSRRMRIAEEGIEELQHYVDTLIVIPNQNLFRIANERTTFADAFAMADQVLHSGVAGITDLMMKPGLINLDFADVRSVMNEMGKAMMGTGEAGGETRALEAADAAISNPLLDEVSMKGARGVLINITGGMDLTLYEVDEAANRVRSEVDPEANIIVGSTFDESLEGTMRVSVVATGIGQEQSLQLHPETAVVQEHLPGSADVAPTSGMEQVQVVEPFEAAAAVQAFVQDAGPDSHEVRATTHKPAETLHIVPGSLAASQAAVSGTPVSEVAGQPDTGISGEAAPVTANVPSPDQPTSDLPSFLGQRPRPVPSSDSGIRKTRRFFERLTRGRKADRENEPVAVHPVEPAMNGFVKSQPPASPVVAPSTVKSARPDSGESLLHNNLEEDQLEIPTFLRRQAN